MIKNKESIYMNLFGWGSANTYYNWKKEKRPIINLLEKYFTKEELQEFFEYGEIEKFEFLSAQPYLYKESEFISILAALEVVGGDCNHIDYLAYALSYDNYEKYLETKQDFLKVFIYSYDSYKAYGNYKNYYTADTLGMAIEQLDLHFPIIEGYLDTIVYFLNTNFLPFVKACIFNQPQYINLAIEFCIRYNLYKYKSTNNFEEIYQKFKISSASKITYDTVIEKFDFENFKNAMKKIQES